MADIIITPGSSLMSFTSSANFTQTLTQDASGSLIIQGSGSTGRTDILTVNGNNGTLFSVSDDLSDSLFSANTIAGLPVIEAFADNTVKLGKYGAEAIVISGSDNTLQLSGSIKAVSLGTSADTNVVVFNTTTKQIAYNTALSLQGTQGTTGTATQGATGASVQGIQGVQGTQGVQGITGNRGGIPYTFSATTTDSDPGNGTIRFNNASFASVTQIYIDNQDSLTINQTGWFDTWDDSTNTQKGYLVIQGLPSVGLLDSVIFSVTGITAATGYYKINVTYVSGGVAFSGGDALALSFSRTGNLGAQGTTGTATQGATGTATQGTTGAQGTTGTATQGTTGAQGTTGTATQGTTGAQGTTGTATQGATGTATQGATGAQGTTGAQGIQGRQGITGTQGTTGASVQGANGNEGESSGVIYAFDTSTTDSDPGNGNLRYNNGTLASVSFIYIDDLDRTGASQTAWYDTWDDSTNSQKGYLIIQTLVSSVGPNITVFSITGNVTVAAGYYKIPVSYISGGPLFTGTPKIVVNFSRTGNLGAQGATGTATQGATGASVQGSQGTTGTATQGATGTQGTNGTQGIQGITGPGSSITTTSTATATTFYPIFSSVDGGGTTPFTDAGLAYNPSTNILTTTATSATNASNIAITNTTTGVGPYYPVFVSSTSGNQAARVDSSTLTYNATTNLLTVTSSYASNGGYALRGTLATTSTNPAQNTTYYGGGAATNALSATLGSRRLHVPKAGAIKACIGFFWQTAGSTGLTSTLSISSSAGFTTVGSAGHNAAATGVNNYALNIGVTQGSYIEFRWVTPAWGTAPTAPASLSAEFVVLID